MDSLRWWLLLLAAVMFSMSGCASKDQWNAWTAHPSHYASANHWEFSQRTGGNIDPKIISEADREVAMKEGWWGDLVPLAPPVDLTGNWVGTWKGLGLFDSLRQSDARMTLLQDGTLGVARALHGRRHRRRRAVAGPLRRLGRRAPRLSRDGRRRGDAAARQRLGGDDRPSRWWATASSARCPAPSRSTSCITPQTASRRHAGPRPASPRRHGGPRHGPPRRSQRLGSAPAKPWRSSVECALRLRRSPDERRRSHVEALDIRQLLIAAGAVDDFSQGLTGQEPP